MELEKCESDSMWSKYINKELIGTGSNGNRVYRVLNTKDKKVNNRHNSYNHLDLRDEEDNHQQVITK